MKQETIEQIRQALKQATAGPWESPRFEQCIWGTNPKTGGSYFVANVENIANARLIKMLVNHAPALLDEIARLRARVAELEDCRRTCAWRECDDFEAPGTYLTACGHYWSFTEGDVKDNSAVYCQYCGGKIEENES